MVQTCYICKWRADKEPRRSFHKFPFDENEKQKWLDIIGKSNVCLGKRTSICSIHFDKTCFRYGLVNGRELLRPGSIPTLQLTKPPEPDVLSDLYYHVPLDVEVKLEVGEEFSEWNPSENVPVEYGNGVIADSIDKNGTKNNEHLTEIHIDVPPLVKKTNVKKNKVKVKQIKKQFKKSDKPSYLRELVERLRRDHIKLKNYIQTLEEQQNTAQKHKKKY